MSIVNLDNRPVSHQSVPTYTPLTIRSTLFMLFSTSALCLTIHPNAYAAYCVSDFMMREQLFGDLPAGR